MELDSEFSKNSEFLPFVRIVHGKGTGKLRAAVREALRKHAYVRSFEEAHPSEGGEGVTVALIAT